MVRMICGLAALGMIVCPLLAKSAPTLLAFSRTELGIEPEMSEMSEESARPEGAGRAGGSPKARPTPIVWKPRVVGAPQERVGGAVRGSSDLANPMALVPNHLALTLSPAPSLFWHLDGPASDGVAIIFTLVDERGEAPLVESELAPPDRAGIQRVRLGDYGVALKLGQTYTWSVALVPDREDRSQDRISLGLIQRTQVTGAAPREAEEFAARGLWYDALEALSDAVDKTPEDAEALARRGSLLSQAGLLPGAE